MASTRAALLLGVLFLFSAGPGCMLVAEAADAASSQDSHEKAAGRSEEDDQGDDQEDDYEGEHDGKDTRGEAGDAEEDGEFGQDGEGEDGRPEDGDHEDNDERAPDEEEDEEEVVDSETLRNLHAKFDTNKDSKVSMEELLGHGHWIKKDMAKKHTPTLLEALDGDKDGKLSREEYLKHINEENGDSKPGHGGEGEVERKERLRFEMAKFEAVDTNRDGLLDQEEAYGIFHPETHDGVVAFIVADVMQRIDTNKDGKLTSKEFFGVPTGPAEGKPDVDGEDDAALFAEMDTNSDGFMDAQELHHVESGAFDIEQSMKLAFELADKDADQQLTADELANSAPDLVGKAASYHFEQWADHHELSGEKKEL